MTGELETVVSRIIDRRDEVRRQAEIQPCRRPGAQVNDVEAALGVGDGGAGLLNQGRARRFDRDPRQYTTRRGGDDAGQAALRGRDARRKHRTRERDPRSASGARRRRPGGLGIANPRSSIVRHYETPFPDLGPAAEGFIWRETRFPCADGSAL